MKRLYYKIIATALVASMGASFTACGSKDSGSASSNNTEIVTATNANGDIVTSIATNAAADASIQVESDTPMKQNLVVQVDSGEDAQEATADATEANENGGNGNVSYEVVTNSKGQPVTDANGETQTRAVSGGGSNGSTSYQVVTDNKGQPETDAKGNTETEVVTNNAGSSDYKSDIRTVKTYWLDMTNRADFVFKDGDFFVAKFKVKDSAPDGSYPINISKADIANYDGETLYPEIANGYVTVGNASTPETSQTTAGNFAFQVESQKAKAGNEISVPIKISNDPGFVAFVFNFTFDANALDFENLEVGSVASDTIQLNS